MVGSVKVISNIFTAIIIYMLLFRHQHTEYIAILCYVKWCMMIRGVMCSHLDAGNDCPTFRFCGAALPTDCCDTVKKL